METTKIDFKTVYSTYYKRVIYHINQRVNDKMLAEDLASQAFLKLYNYINDFDSSKSNIEAWVFRTANSVIYDYRKLKSTKTTSNFTNYMLNNNITDTDNLNIAVNNNDNQSILESKEFVNNVKRIINKCSDIQIKIANLYFFNDLSYADISKLTNLSLEKVRVYIYRIKAKLQKELSGYKLAYNLK